MKKYKDLIIGFLAGVAIPIVAYAIIMIIFEQLTDAGIMGELSSSHSVIKRLRTMGVLAIAANLLPLNFFKRKKNFSSIKGVVFATLVYAFIWIVYYWESIMN